MYRQHVDRMAVAEAEQVLHDTGVLLGQLRAYATVPAAGVTYGGVVEHMADLYAQSLGIACFVHFFAETDLEDPSRFVHRPVWGMAQRLSARIWVHADLADEWDALAVAAHEVAHLAQPATLSHAEAEADAEAFARRMTGRDTQRHMNRREGGPR